MPETGGVFGSAVPDLVAVFGAPVLVSGSGSAVVLVGLVPCRGVSGASGVFGVFGRGEQAGRA
jgi:hypothetical protein